MVGRRYKLTHAPEKRDAVHSRPSGVREFRDGLACSEFLDACNTGHTGNLSTVHANGPREAIQRIMDLLRKVPGLNPQVGEVIDAIGMIIHMARDEGVRGIVGVYHPYRTENGGFDVDEIA